MSVQTYKKDSNAKYNKQIMEPYLTVGQVTRFLNISRMTLNRMTKAGKIQGYKIGRSVRYKREDVEKALVSTTEIQDQETPAKTA